MESERTLITKLVAYCLTDGSVACDPETGKFCRIILTNKSKSLLRDFGNTLKALGHEPRRESCARAEQVVTRSAELAKRLLELTPTYRTRPCEHHPICARIRDPRRTGACISCEPIVYDGVRFPPAMIPESLLDSPTRTGKFIQIAASCDGGVRFSANTMNPLRIRRQVFLSSTHPTIRVQYAHLLTQIGIQSRIEGPSVVIMGNHNLQTFAKKVGFVNGCHVLCGRWQGLEKNTVLRMAIKSYTHPPTIWGKQVAESRGCG